MKLRAPGAAMWAASSTTSWKTAVVRRRRIRGVIIRWTSTARCARADLLVLAVHVVVRLVVARREPRRWRWWRTVCVGVVTSQRHRRRALGPLRRGRR
eukprot:15674199-Heterocapsa_arctica.AAC.1